MMVVGCAHSNTNSEGRYHMNTFTKNTKVYDVINNTSFKGYGKLIFPVDRKIDKDMTLDESKSLYIWYNYINSNKTVEIVNYMKQQADSKKQIFYNIYTEEEMRADPE